MKDKQVSCRFFQVSTQNICGKTNTFEIMNTFKVKLNGDTRGRSFYTI